MNQMISDYLDKGGYGAAARLSERSGLKPPAICKLKKATVGISLRVAITLDKATNGSLRAEKLCPEEAELITYLRSTKGTA